MSMITKGKAKVLGKSVLLYSGGMDSLMLAKILEPDVLLYVPSGSKYANEETDVIHKQASDGHIDGSKLVVAKALDLKQYERDDFIVPNRNAHLVLLASNYGEQIFLGSVAGDRSFDKDEDFYRHMETLLNHMHQEQHWTEGRIFTISAPAKTLTKSELVTDYFNAGGTVDALLKSYSCYSGEKQPCGHCKPCFRKAVALINNGIAYPDDYFKHDPFTAPWLEVLYENMLDGNTEGDRGRETKEWNLALAKAYKLKNGKV